MKIKLLKSPRLFCATTLLFLFATSIALAKDGTSKPYPLLQSTPAHICKNLILGAQYGRPANPVLRSFFEGLIGLRYNIETKGLDPILERGDQGILFLPNHSAYIDPLIMIAAIGGSTNLRPVMTEDLTRGAFGAILKNLVSLTNAFILPGRNRGAEAINAVLNEIDNATSHGDNVLFYPSGRTQNSTLEQLGAKSGLARLMRRNPDRRIVLVRERGLWGSSWSRGAEGVDPAQQSASDVIARGLSHGFKSLLANGLVFAPRRTVTLEFFEPEDFPRRGTREEMNSYLERFYNDKSQPERRMFVRQFFWQFWRERVRVVESEEDFAGDIRGRGEVIEVGQE